MDEPVRKRRRTVSPSERDRQSSPLKKPPRRPSFASPTKSSLARNYPDLVRAKSAAAPAVRPSKEGNHGPARGEQGEGMEDQDTVFRAERKLRRSPIPRADRNGNGTGVSATRPVQSPEDGPDPRDRHSGPSPSKQHNLLTNPVEQSPSRPKSHSVLKDNLPVKDGPIGQVDTPDVIQSRELPDPEVEKRRQEKVRLQREIELLESHVAQCAEEIVKEQQRSPDQSLQAQERTNLL